MRPRCPARRRARRCRRLRRRLGARCRQGHRLHVRPDAADVGFRGYRRLVDARRSERHRADRRGADDRRNRLRSRPRRRHHPGGDPYEEDHLPSADDAEGRDLRSGADRRHAAEHHGRHGHGCARPLPRGLLRARLSPDGRRHRRRRHAPREGVPAARHRDGDGIEARAQHDVGRGDGRDRLPEGARRDPRAVPSGGRALRHASRPDERGLHALCARLQPQGRRP